MVALEQELYNQLVALRDNRCLQGIKAEFEAEGAEFNDVVRLRRLTALGGVKLYLKIGGVEAVRDIKDALELGVDGIIAPMVESAFGAKKFILAYKKIYGDIPIHTTLNIETKNGIEQLSDILQVARGNIDNITAGRSDLSGSYMDSMVVPDCEFISSILEEAGRKVIEAGMTFTVGGSITRKTVEMLSQRAELRQLIFKLETRKVILPTEVLLSDVTAVRDALRFEELFILSKKAFLDNRMADEMNRLTSLKGRG